VDVDVADLARPIDHEYRALGDALLAQHPILDRDVAVRPEIAQHRVR